MTIAKSMPYDMHVSKILNTNFEKYKFFFIPFIRLGYNERFVQFDYDIMIHGNSKQGYFCSDYFNGNYKECVVPKVQMMNAINSVKNIRKRDRFYDIQIIKLKKEVKYGYNINMIISGDKLITMRDNLRYNHNMKAHKMQ